MGTRAARPPMHALLIYAAIMTPIASCWPSHKEHRAVSGNSRHREDVTPRGGRGGGGKGGGSGSGSGGGNSSSIEPDLTPGAEVNATSLAEYFHLLKHGPGLWKWNHYFDLYERHLARFRGKEVHLVEIGIYSGGSLRMWRWYLGEKAHIYGVDISPRTKIYERNPDFGNPDRIFVGDQNSSSFWKDVLAQLPRVDIVLDDGGHLYDLQRTTLDATWPQMAIPGVYICEDLWCRMGCKFTDYVEEKWVRGINAAGSWPPSPLSRGYNGANVMFYPRMTVIEKHRPFIPREGSHGTYWQPHVKSMMDEGMKLLRERGRSEVVAGKR